MTSIVYPLLQVLQIKERRVEQAEKVVLEKEKALQIEQKKLAQAEAERDKAVEHKNEKLRQLREEMDHATTSPKIQQMKAYLKVVDERVKVENKKVETQKEQVRIAEENLEAAKEDLRIKRREVDKLLTHRKEWVAEMQIEINLAQEKELDEVGTISYLSRKRRGF